MADPPRSLGFRMPAEWEPHEATWIAWPHNRTDWPGKLAAVQWVYGEIVRKVAPGETVRILARSPEESARVRRLLRRIGLGLDRIELFRVPTDRSWTRGRRPRLVPRRAGAP